MIRTALTELVDCAIPVQQAPMGPPMGGVSSPDLVAAVADGGGIGSFSCLGMSPDEVERFVGGLADKTTGVLAANFLTPDVEPKTVEAAADLVRVVDFFWSRPNPELVRVAHGRGALVFWQVGSVAEAKEAREAGCDAVVVQGTEAGGHVWGESALLPLLARVLDVVDVPVIAAGGIGSARSVSAALAAGATGVRVGTRFIATEESGAHPAYVEAILRAEAEDTEITGEFSLCPLCAIRPRARVLRSALDAVRSLSDEVVGQMTMPDGRIEDVPRFAGAPPVRNISGRVEAMAMYAGQSVGAVTEVQKAANVLQELAAGAEHVTAGSGYSRWRSSTDG